tara:strand:+ start:14424 stop:15119 length:696 start_codon:yes stop_codon:yes gene_type:complete
MMQQLIDKQKYVIYLIIFLLLSSVNNINLTKFREKVSSLKIIQVEGLNKNLNNKIKRDLDFLINSNIYKLNNEIISNKLDKYNYIDNYKVFKEYPSKIKIELVQAKFLAETIKNNQRYFIGSNGKLIDYKIFNYKENIPNVFGNFTSKDFIELNEVLKKTNFKFEHIQDIFFYPSGRWDIKTKKNLILKLPRKNVYKAIDKFNLISKNEELKEYNVIDLRIPNQLILSNEQ